ncbi:flagellar hook-length control protein FliK [Sporolactobacillus sp. THM7-7]|nr:flagellar hook-length control protein FliK [Sporolactobacillus sp. THM7-7]
MSHVELWMAYSDQSESGRPPVPQQVADRMAKWIAQSSFTKNADGEQKLTMTLYPEQLGQLTLSVEKGEDGIIARLSVETKQAKRLLDSGLPQLKQDLAARGVSIIEKRKRLEAGIAVLPQKLMDERTGSQPVPNIKSAPLKHELAWHMPTQSADRGDNRSEGRRELRGLRNLNHLPGGQVPLLNEETENGQAFKRFQPITSDRKPQEAETDPPAKKSVPVFSAEQNYVGRHMSHVELWMAYSDQSESGRPSVPQQVADRMAKWIAQSSFTKNADGEQKLTMTLYPEQLGQLTLSVEKGKAGIIARLSVETKQAKRLLDSGLPQLKQDLAARGVSMIQIDIARQSPPQRGDLAWQNGQSQQQPFQNDNGQPDRQDGREKDRGSRPASKLNSVEEEEFSFLDLLTKGG